MNSLVTHRLTLDVQATHPAIYFGLLGVWGALLLAFFLSLRSLDISMSTKVAWLAFVFFVPILGLFSYCGYCLTKGDWSFFKLLLSKPSAKETGRGR